MTDHRILSDLSIRGALFASGLLLVTVAHSAEPKQMECDPLLTQIRAERGVPNVTILMSEAKVRIDAKGAFCTEPISKWAKREPFEMPRPGPPPRKKKKKWLKPGEEEPLPIRPSGPGKTPFARPAGKRPDCSYEVTDMWEMGTHSVDNFSYWLTRVFTIDFDGDGATDDVGFLLMSPDHEDIELTYFGGEETRSARDIPGLVIDDESVIKKICFSNKVFADKPPDTTSIKVFGLDQPEGDAAE